MPLGILSNADPKFETAHDKDIRACRDTSFMMACKETVIVAGGR